MKNYLDQEMAGILNKIKGFKEGDEEKEEDKVEENGKEEENQKEDEGSGDEKEAEEEEKGESEEEEYYTDENGRRRKRRKTKTRTTVTRTVTSSITVNKKKKEESEEEDTKPKIGFKGLGSGEDDEGQVKRTKTTVTRDKNVTRKSYGGRLIGTNPDKEVAEKKDTDEREPSPEKVEGEHLLSKVTQEETDKVLDLDPRRRSTKKKTTRVSILRKKAKTMNSSKSVRFNTKEIEQKETDVNEEFIRKVPTGTIALTGEQRDMLIEVLEEPGNEEDDLILSLEPGQVKEVVQENFEGANATVVVDPSEKRNVLQNRKSRVSIYPRNFFAMVEKKRLKGSRISVYPGDFFDNIEKGVARKDPSRGEGRVTVYPKDLFKLVDDEIDEGRISIYPQEMFDLFRECGDQESSPGVRKKARTIYTGEFMRLVDKQAERGTRKRQKTVYPKELFEMAEQEKINGERVSVYPRELFKLLSKEAQKQRASVYPKDLFDLLDSEYSNVIKLTPAQSEQLVDKNVNGESTHIVLSEGQRKDLLGKLKDHKQKENKGGEAGDLEVALEKDQVLDILHQNCMTDGTAIDLTPQQKKELVEVRKIRPTMLGNEYYDVLVDQLVNDQGDRLELNRVSGTERRSLLDQLGPQKVSVVEVTPEEKPEVLSQTHYDTKHDEVVSRKSRKSALKLGENESTRKSRVSQLVRKSLAQPRRTSMIGRAYYDAMVNELVDETGQRFSLEDKSKKEIQSLIKDKDMKKVAVLVDGDKQDEDPLLLNQVEYLPGNDCLVDEKGRKTGLNDLSQNERNSLMKILGERRGTRVSENSESQFGSKGVKFGSDADANVSLTDSQARRIRNRKKTGFPGTKQARFGSGNKPMNYIQRERDLERIRQRKKTGHPGISPEKKAETERLKKEILHGETSPENRGSMVHPKSGSKERARRANTLHPKDRKSPDVETSDFIPESSPERPGKNIQDKRMTMMGSPVRPNFSKRKTMGSKSPESMSKDEFRRLGELERERRAEEKRKELERKRLEDLEKKRQEELERERQAEKLRKELEKKKQDELEKARRKKAQEERLERERKRLEDLRLANERKRLQQLKIAQEKKRIEEERAERTRKRNEELRRLSELKKKERAEELRQRKTVHDLKEGKGKKPGARKTMAHKMGQNSGVRGKATTMLVRDRRLTETSDGFEESEPQPPSRKSTQKRKTTTTNKRKTITRIQDQYYPGNQVKPKKKVVSGGLNLMDGQESPLSETSQEKRKRREKEEQIRKKKLEAEQAQRNLVTGGENEKVESIVDDKFQKSRNFRVKTNEKKWASTESRPSTSSGTTKWRTRPTRASRGSSRTPSLRRSSPGRKNRRSRSPPGRRKCLRPRTWGPTRSVATNWTRGRAGRSTSSRSRTTRSTRTSPLAS